ncbi:pyridoxal phosphate-dependent decarboxylase family protein [Bdellovibrio reynosensis]|uniref:Pyridoxal-dependent decarboxylase n=1 Tax=Bdellovibrio reynosensis TaxID=2835041 RepID=A0ABY4CDC4_9BACT|nr:pyridoxal-dependent decarboxylase [Bdellovibrio reynosensis]UOF01528.1 pyridoxal-dependent decarboxylase [Bdellovibrio reynosensis]
MNPIKCSTAEAALKGLFLGPQAENREWVAEQISQLLKSWFEWRQNSFPKDGWAISRDDMQSAEYLSRRKNTEETLKYLTTRFEAEIPKFSPRYIGHMFSEMSLPALFGHILTLLHNPNNISGESSKVGVFIEDEAIQALSKMIGYPQGSGHFTSGGTIANFEAVYRARSRCYSWLSAGLASGITSAFSSSVMGWHQYDNSKVCREEALKFNPLEGNPFEVSQRIFKHTHNAFLGPVLLVPEHKHYSWVKAANVFGLGAESFWSVRLDNEGRMDVKDLANQILKAEQEDRPILMAVSVLGTTELGMIDPIHKVQEVLDSYRASKGWHIWHHIDAAYGGFFCSLLGQDITVSNALSTESLKALSAVATTTSLTIDPHKLGYVPYSSGAFLTSNPRDYFQNPFGAPYVDFKAQQAHTDKGPFTLEGSRSATGAVATWMTANCIGLSQEGYGKIIARTIQLKSEFEKSLKEEVRHLRVAPSTDTNLIGFCLAAPGETLSKSNARTLEAFKNFHENKDQVFFVSKTKINKKSYELYINDFVNSWEGQVDSDELVLIRLCIMNPFFKTKEMKVDYQKLFISTLKEMEILYARSN